MKEREDFSQPVDPLIDRNNPPMATRGLNRQVLCGLCAFKCCQASTFNVRLTEAESKKLDLPILFQIDKGGCRCLTETGCSHGEDRPVLCKTHPMEFDFKKNKIKLSFWSLVHCPSPKDFEFVGMSDGKYEYKRKELVRGFKKSNIQERVLLDHPIEEFPNMLEFNVQGLVELYGEEAVEKIRESLRKLNEPEEKPEPIPYGFDLEMP